MISKEELYVLISTLFKYRHNDEYNSKITNIEKEEFKINKVKEIKQELENKINPKERLEETDKQKQLQISKNQYEQSRNKLLESWLQALNWRDNYTSYHSLLVAKISTMIYNAIQKDTKLDTFYKLNDKDVYNLEKAAQYHDIGKIALSDSILKGSTSLSEDQNISMRKHPELSFKILHDAFADIDDSLIWLIIALFHHWDYEPKDYEYGSRLRIRYPQGLDADNEEKVTEILNNLYGLKVRTCKDIHAVVDNKTEYLEKYGLNEENKISIRKLRLLIGIIHVADTLHAACEKRSYKVKKDFSTLLTEEIIPENGKQYHPDVIDIIEKNSELNKELSNLFK